MALSALLKAATTISKQAAKQGGRYAGQAGKQTVEYVVKNPGNTLKYTAAAAAGGVATVAGQQFINTATGVVDTVKTTLDEINEGVQNVLGGPVNAVDEIVDDVTGRDNSTLTSLLLAGAALTAVGFGVYALTKED